MQIEKYLDDQQQSAATVAEPDAQAEVADELDDNADSDEEDTQEEVK